MTQIRRVRTAVAVSDLFCLYPVPQGTVAALRGLSLRVGVGERLVVHGPNGSGKTTLLRVLMGDQPSSAGEVEVAGVDLAGADETTRSELRLRQLGVVDQHAGRTLAPGARRPRQRRAADAAGRCPSPGGPARADDALSRLGLAELANRSTATLSGGEAQRVAVCAALAHGPAVVLADEPTGELDADSADAVYDLLGAAVRDAGATLGPASHTTGELPGSPTGSSGSATAGSPRSGRPTSRTARRWWSTTAGGSGCPSRCAGPPAPRKAYALPPRVTGSCCRDSVLRPTLRSTSPAARRRPTGMPPAPSRSRGSRACGWRTAREWCSTPTTSTYDPRP